MKSVELSGKTVRTSAGIVSMTSQRRSRSSSFETTLLVKSSSGVSRSYATWEALKFTS
jgi:hypothetical protein